MNIQRIVSKGKLSNGNSFQEIKISSRMDILIDNDENLYIRYNSEQKVYFAYQIGYEQALSMSLYDIKMEFLEYLSEMKCDAM